MATVSLNLVGCKISFEVELDDEDVVGKSDDEIEQMALDEAQEIMFNYLDLWVEKVDE